MLSSDTKFYKFIGSLEPQDVEAISSFLKVDCTHVGNWAKLQKIDSGLEFAICDDGNHFIRLEGTTYKGYHYPVKAVTTYVSTDGYITVSGFGLMHRLVAEAFMDVFVPYPEMEINHLDGNKSNNSISNLELTTHQKNIHHFFNDARMSHYKDSWLSKHIGSKRTEEQLAHMRGRKHNVHWTPEALAKISATHKGKKLSPAHIARIKEANTCNNHTAGRISVTDGTINTYIHPDQLDEYLSKGFKRGRIVNVPKHRAPYNHSEAFLRKQRERSAQA